MAERVCPWWMGYLLSCPVRRLFEKPEKILGDHIQPGMTILDIGCAMGFFTLPAAKMVGSEGQVVAIDLQEKMINSLRRRAKRAGLLGRMDIRLCSETNLGISDLSDQVDLSLVFHVVHEVPDANSLMTELYMATKPGGQLLVAEPKGHVSAEAYKTTETLAQQAGFSIVDRPELKRSLSTMFVKSK